MILDRIALILVIIGALTGVASVSSDLIWLHLSLAASLLL